MQNSGDGNCAKRLDSGGGAATAAGKDLMEESGRGKRVREGKQRQHQAGGVLARELVAGESDSEEGGGGGGGDSQSKDQGSDSRRRKEEEDDADEALESKADSDSDD